MRLIFHIGAGKTGSTSIQSVLKHNDKELKKQGVWYLGLMLERTEKIQYSWQRNSSVVEDFHRLSPQDAKEQLLNVLSPIMEEARANNIETLIWSNESFLGGNHNFIPAIKELQQQGIRVDVLIYVREYLSWIRSAYTQWGLKHKTYLGKLKNFGEWSAGNKPSFYKQMEPLLRVMPNSVYVRNMNAVGDVVEDFCMFAGIKAENMRFFRENDSPQNEELVLRSLFNSKFHRQVLPSVYELATDYKGVYKKTPSKYLESLIVPSEEDIQSILHETRDDHHKLNELLQAQGQRPLVEREYASKSTEVNTEKLLFALADIVMTQSNKISQLERQISQLEQEIKDER